MAQERWDVVIRVLEGPLASSGEIVLRGPIIRMGANPGPGGFRLHGYRGMDARQAVITAYEGGEVTVSPVGTNQVRVAPHPNVSWKEIDPISRPVYLTKGCAMHLGPVGRGATLEYMRAQRLGVWVEGRIGSEAEAVESVQLGSDQPLKARAIPDAIKVERRRTTRISAATIPLWFLGCAGMMSMATVALLVAVVVFRTQQIEDLGPKIDGDEFYPSVQVDQKRLDRLPEGVREGMQVAFYTWVMRPNQEASGRGSLAEVALWDQVLYDHVQMAVVQHSESRSFWNTLKNVRAEYATVVQAMRDASLPEVFAAIPYRESRYTADAQSVVCAKGYWQFMPENAHRLFTREGLDFEVRDCDIRGVLWTPSALATPPNIFANAPYVGGGQCLIPARNGCRVDARTDLERSTEAAVFSQGEAFQDKELRKSGAVVQITIASHNAGYADGRFDRFKSTNLLPAYKRWAKSVPDDDHPRFYGANLLCASDMGNPDGDTYCNSVLPAQTQHYVYPIIATHILAACYYGKNYFDQFKAFEPYRELVASGYCSDFPIPDAAETGVKK